MAQPVTVEPVTLGRATIKTTAGDIAIEFWPREAPKAVRNFVQLALEGYYEGCEWHRVVPGLLVQTGDATNTGEGGESIYDDVYEDEISQRLLFRRRGLLAMANAGRRHTNLSQFFITLDRADGLQNKHTIFATVRGDTYFNVLAISESELHPDSDKPVYPTIIKEIVIDENPMPDIEPRITGAEKRQQEKARKEARKNAAKGRRKKEGVKNKSLMSFEEEEEAGGSGATVKITSAHDALNDPSLSKEVLSRRGLPGAMPEGFGERPSQHDSLTQKRKADQLDGSSNGQRAGSESAKPWDSAAFATKVDRNGSSSSAATKQLEGYLAGNKKRKESATGPTSESDRVRAEIAKVQADLKKMTRKDKGSDDEDGAATKSKKAKESGAALLAAERAKYSQGGRKLGKAGEGKGKKRAEEDEDLMSMLDGFRSRVRAAVVEGVQTSSEPATDAAAATDGYAGEILEEQFDDNDGGWLGHALQFRKDATMDQHSIDEYEVVDPREKGMTLEDAKREDERRKRKTQQGRGDGGRTRDAERQIDRRDRGGPNSNRARERY